MSKNGRLTGVLHEYRGPVYLGTVNYWFVSLKSSNGQEILHWRISLKKQ